MSIGEILKTALIDTALGMGTVFAILILISIVIWALGRIVGGVKPKKAAGDAGAAAGDAAVSDTGSISSASGEAGGAGTGAIPAVNADGLTPELVAVISTVAINQHLREQKQAAAADGYVVRNIRRSTWRRS